MNKKYLALIIIVVLLAGIGIYQFLLVRKAHSSFENYYAFRGCTQLVGRIDTAGTCITRSGQTINMVEYKNKWYLDGDLPVCTFNVCF